jgi:hypothetical protein
MNNTEFTPSQSITLTSEQQKIYDELIKFIKSDKEQQIILSSSAGTGKTTIVTKIINDSLKNKLCNRIVIATPTHKSLSIAKSKLFSTSSTSTISNNIDIMTIHRLLNYQKNIDSSGEVYYGKSGADTNWSIYQIIIIDECSMLSLPIINDIETELKKPKNSKLKIIFTGDPCQLNPVGELVSPIFTKKIKTLTLEKIIRTKSQNIMQLSNSHRGWITSNNDKDMPCLSDYEDEQIILHSSENVNKWLDKFINILKTPGTNKEISTADSMENNIILTWTNKKCNKYNDYVRHKMFNKKQLDKYEIGEILIFNDFHRILMKIPKDEEDTENDKEPSEEQKIVSFYTSEQIKLLNIKQDKFQFEKIKNLKSTDLPAEIADKFVKNISSINKILTTTALDVYYMKVQKMSELKNKVIATYPILTIHNNSEADYNKLKEFFEEQMIKLKNSCHKMVEELKITKNTETQSFNMIKLEYINIIDKKINRIWKDWQFQVIDRFAQLNYGYAITVHKSQGSTFKNVFIDIMDIFENHNQPERLKCLYTAITRSSHSLELLV